MFDIVPKLLDYVLDKGHLPSFVLGALVAGSLCALFIPHILKSLHESHGREVDRLNAKVNELEKRAGDLDESNEILANDRDRALAESSELTGIQKDLRERIDQLSAECEDSREYQIKTRQWKRYYRKKARHLEEDVARLTKQLADIANTDGQVWDRPPMGEVAPFKTLNLRKMPIISVVNLKGGVGKTTITANLGIALARKGFRVLLIDLDHQCSLTGHCLTPQEFEDHLSSKRSVADIFRSPDDGAGALHRSSIRLTTMDGCETFLIAGEEKFSQLETQLQDRWSAHAMGDDVRYRLRAALHADTIRDRFDMVLLDCPPRLTTGCINAFTASDYLITPVLPDRRSTEAVPRLLRWIRKMRPHVCPDLTVLGVVGNRAKPYKGGITRKDQAALKELYDLCKTDWDSPIHLFKSVIRDHGSTNQRFAAFDPRHQPQYFHLAEEILQEIPAHARRHVDPVPALPLGTA